MIQSLLIANRGEIACRIIRTARRLGVRTVAVYSDADAKAMHVRDADAAVHIGPSPARESYLVGEKIIAAAKESGAEAIHPGYGFLSENAAFAQAVIDAGLIWVGPKPASIRAMGLKDAAKKLMDEAGVPTTPGYLGADQDPARLRAEADKIGYPVLIKAVAGGGGKGMRRVDASEDFADALLSCKREAAASFGDDRVLIEKYILRPRHIEVQVFGDTHGNVVHLFERDCSLQRRHQKVIEEAPAPGMDAATRAAVCDAAVKAAKAVDYVGAGTIEFIADASEGLRADRIWFMEMNTRLQVEHPVTEEITGVDLVEWQLLVASGETLPKRQEELSINGWAMEARLYAENPEAGFLPSTGTLEAYEMADQQVRVDSGVQQGSTITPYYDPMIAKLIRHSYTFPGYERSPDELRRDTCEVLAMACGRATTYPVHNNAAFLAALLRREEFLSGDIDTGFIARHVDELVQPAEPSEQATAWAARLLLQHKGFGSAYAVDPDLGDVSIGGIWKDLSGFRLNADRVTTMHLERQGKVVAAPYVGLDFDGHYPPGHMLPQGFLVIERGAPFLYTLPRGGGAGAGAAAGDGAIVSPMPGKIIAVGVAQGEAVTKGRKLVTLEAMKMEHSLVAPFDGIVAELAAVEGSQVSEGTLLARIEKGDV